jgi:hypothetical protein
MCRIAFTVKPKIKSEIYEGVLAAVFATLELSNGGHGNGIAFPNRKGKIKIIKGVNYRPHEAARDAAGAPWVLFHTRLASSGGISDEMCHPFPLGFWGALVHNGTVIGKGTFTESDTSVMTRVIAEEKGPDPDAIFEYLDRIDPGVVAIALRGKRPKVWLYVGRGRNFVKSAIGPITIWASEALSKESETIGPGLYEIPSGVKIKEVKYTAMGSYIREWWWKKWWERNEYATFIDKKEEEENET